jgi:hypothetical protein
MGGKLDKGLSESYGTTTATPKPLVRGVSLTERTIFQELWRRIGLISA